MTTLSPDSVLQQLALNANSNVVLALSGGLDSMVLLHLLYQARLQRPFSLQAVYVNHGISPNAASWGEFCRTQCANLNIAFRQLPVQLAGRHNLEARARSARYQALTDVIDSCDHLLLTAHHADDQFETLLLALKRGAGPAGLGGIASHNTFGAGKLVRPLLAYSREQIQQFADEHNIEWIEDESNQDTHYDRNFIRQQITPLLQQRWPHLPQTVARSMQHIANLQQLVDHYTGLLYDDVVVDGRLQIPALLNCLPLQQDLLVRRWLTTKGLTPSVQWLDTLRNTVLDARIDSGPVLMLAQYQIRRFNQQLYLLRNDQLIAPQSTVLWQGQSELPLPEGAGRLLFNSQPDQTALPLMVDNAEVLFGKLSLPFKPAGASMHKPVKQWFKLWQVPPWQRLSVPLLAHDGKIVAVAGYAAACTDVQAKHWLLWQQP